jgi:2-dehydro-3-deoxyglucarate aldolase
MTLKEKIKGGKLTLGSWITIGNSAVAEILAKAGFDWLAIDMEHTAINVDQCADLIRVIDLCGVAPFVRVGANDSLLIKQAMDAGAHGVIVPMVNSKEEAERAVESVKYPPVGKRGVGLARAQGYGTTFNEYKDWAANESIVIVQIEHIDAVNNLEEIFSVEGVDAFIVGPYDLSGSLGVPGDFEDKKVEEALDKIVDISKNMNMSSGYHVVSTDYNLVKEKIKQGYSFIAYGVDFLFLGESARGGLAAIKN